MYSKADATELVQKALGTGEQVQETSSVSAFQELGQNTVDHNRMDSINISCNYIIAFIIVLAPVQCNKQETRRRST